MRLRVGKLIDLQRQSVAVAEEEQTHNGHKDHGGLLSSPTELAAPVGAGAG